MGRSLRGLGADVDLFSWAVGGDSNTFPPESREEEKWENQRFKLLSIQV